MTHTLFAGLLSESRPIRVAVAGVGGTGSEVVSGLTHLHLALQAFGYSGLHVTAYDPDTVSQANLVRQRYHPADLGHNKAQTLIKRVDLACNLDWAAVPELFNSRRARQNWDIVVSCVDTRAARKSLHQAAFSGGFFTWRYWLDCGNDLSTGQVILGTPRSGGGLKHPLPCATELHPELMDSSIADDDAPSCSAIEALSRQDLYVGRMVATHALDMLWQLLRHQQLDHHARYFGKHLATRPC